MKIQSILKHGLITTILALSILSYAANTKSNHSPHIQPNNSNKIALQHYEKNFDFNWNDYSTIASNKTKLEKTETYLRTINDYTHLSQQDREAAGRLYYKLGTFYTHVLREPNLAIDKLNMAALLLTNKQEQAWNNNHLAYAYEQKFAATGQTFDKEKALNYINIVIAKLYSNAKNKEVAFAYCVKGLVLNDAKEYLLAELSFKIALGIYETLPDGKDDQYARAKNRLANIILDQNGRDQKALALLIDLKKYWLAKNNIDQDPYAARNFISLGQAYLKMGEVTAAQTEITNAIQIYKNVYGSHSTLLAKPYQLLAETYKKQKNLKQAALYEEKITALSN